MMFGSSLQSCRIQYSKQELASDFQELGSGIGSRFDMDIFGLSACVGLSGGETVTNNNNNK